MNQKRYRDQLGQKRLSRRAVLQAGAFVSASLIGLGTTGCEGNKGSKERLSTTPVSDTPKTGGVFAFSTPDDPPSFDVHQETTYAVTHVTLPAYSGLLQFDPLDPSMSKIVPDLATKWEVSPDGLTYTFHLVEGAKFHDGSPVTAEDVKFSFDRIRMPPTGMNSPRKSEFGIVASIDTPSPVTVVFKLKNKSASFLGNIASPYQVIMPKKVVEAQGDMKKTIVGSGPFKLKEYTRGSSVEFVKNTDYFVKGRPYLDGIKRYIIPDAAAALAAFKTRKLTTVGIDQDVIDPLKKELGDRVEIQVTPRLCSNDLIPTQSGPLKDPKVRQAVSLALDRWGSMLQAIPGSSVSGYMSTAGQWSLSESELVKMPGFGRDVKANREQAKRVLAEAGYPNGFELRITTRTLASYQDATVWAIDQLSQVGIKAKMDALETTAYFDALNKRQFEAIVGVF